MPSLKYINNLALIGTNLPFLEPLFPKVQYGAADTTLMDRCNQNLWHLGRSWRMHFTIYLPLENSYSVENVQFHTAPNCVQIAAKIHKIPDKGNTDSVLKSVTTNRSMVLGKSLMKKKIELPFFSR